MVKTCGWSGWKKSCDTWDDNWSYSYGILICIYIYIYIDIRIMIYFIYRISIIVCFGLASLIGGVVQCRFLFSASGKSFGAGNGVFSAIGLRNFSKLWALESSNRYQVAMFAMSLQRFIFIIYHIYLHTVQSKRRSRCKHHVSVLWCVHSLEWRSRIGGKAFQRLVVWWNVQSTLFVGEKTHRSTDPNIPQQIDLLMLLQQLSRSFNMTCCSFFFI